jgi:hypothetical protein
LFAAPLPVCSIRPISSTNVRETPENRGEENLLRAYDSRQVFRVNGRLRNAQGELWWRVNLPQFDGRDFWMVDSQVRKEGDCDRIPLIEP